MRLTTYQYGDEQQAHILIGMWHVRRNDVEPKRQIMWSDLVCIDAEHVAALSDADLVERIRHLASLVPAKREEDERLRESENAAALGRADRRPLNKAPSNLYLMRSNGLYKIGIGKSVDSRRKALVTASGYAVEVIGSWSMPNDQARAAERRWHDYFADARMAGEWFALDAECIHELMTEMNGAAT